MTADLAGLLQRAAAAIGDHDPKLARAGKCLCLQCRSERLAARGWPGATIGDGRRTSERTSPTERAASARDPFAVLADRTGPHVERLRAEALAVLAIAGVIDSHADDSDPLPAGAGACKRCSHTCNSRQRGPNDRLRAGWCPACHRRYLRLTERCGYRPDRGWFNRTSDDDLAGYDPPAEDDVA